MIQNYYGRLSKILLNAEENKVITIEEICNEVGQKITNKYEMGNMFDKYFTEIGSKLASQIERNMNVCDTSLQFSCTSLISEKTTSFFLKPVCETEILMHIRQINPDKSMGPEGIPRKYLKLSAPIISPILAKFYNNCIQSGTYPSALKIGRVVPIHKSGTKNACSNYRPRSLLSPLTKLFEKCLHERLYAYLEKFKLLTPNWF